MPSFTSTIELALPIERLFALFLDPAASLALMPAELNLRLIEGPKLLTLGSRLIVQGRRWGLSQRMVTEVTKLEMNIVLVEEQREGPFRRFVHERRFTAIDPGKTQLTDQIDFDPPGGLLGLTLTAARIEKDFTWALAERNRRIKAES